MKINKKKLQSLVLDRVSERLKQQIPDFVVTIQNRRCPRIIRPADHAEFVLALAEMGYKTRSQGMHSHWSPGLNDWVGDGNPSPQEGNTCILLYQIGLGERGERIWLEINKEMAQKMMVLGHFPDLNH
jgi:hypothetical protein